MSRLLVSVAAFALLTMPAIAAEPMTDAELDKVTAGDTLGGGGQVRTIVLGSYSLVFDGARWSIVFN